MSERPSSGQKVYPCGCAATGTTSLPDYCPEHGARPKEERVWDQDDIDNDMGVDQWKDDEDEDEYDEAIANCHGNFDEQGPGGVFQCGAVGSEDCDECPLHRWLGLTNKQIDRLEDIDE